MAIGLAYVALDGERGSKSGIKRIDGGEVGKLEPDKGYGLRIGRGIGLNEDEPNRVGAFDPNPTSRL